MRALLDRWSLTLTGVGFIAAVLLVPGNSADAVADWLVVRAVADGYDPHAVVTELAGNQGLLLPEYTFRHPRLPSAILLHMPYALVPFEWMRYAGKVIALGPLLLAWIVVRPRWPALLLVVPALRGLYEGNSSSLVTLFVALALAHRSGIALGLATGIRAWPWYLGLVFLALGRWRVAVTAGLVFVVLNLAGLLLPGVTLVGTLQSFGDAYHRFASPGGGLSPSLLISLPAGIAFLLLVNRRREVARFGVVPALMLSPVVWTHYLTALMVPLGERVAETDSTEAG